MPSINDLAKIDLSKVDLSKAANDLTRVAQDAAYVAIGLGVLGYQKAQVRRRELQSQLEGLQSQVARTAGAGQTPATDVRKEFGKALKEIDKTVAQFIERWDNVVEPVAERLPANAQAALQQAKDARDHLRGYLTSLAA